MKLPIKEIFNRLIQRSSLVEKLIKIFTDFFRIVLPGVLGIYFIGSIINTRILRIFRRIVGASLLDPILSKGVLLYFILILILNISMFFNTLFTIFSVWCGNERFNKILKKYKFVLWSYRFVKMAYNFWADVLIWLMLGTMVFEHFFRVYIFEKIILRILYGKNKSRDMYDLLYSPARRWMRVINSKSFFRQSFHMRLVILILINQILPFCLYYFCFVIDVFLKQQIYYTIYFGSLLLWPLWLRYKLYLCEIYSVKFIEEIDKDLNLIAINKNTRLKMSIVELFKEMQEMAIKGEAYLEIPDNYTWVYRNSPSEEFIFKKGALAKFFVIYFFGTYVVEIRNIITLYFYLIFYLINTICITKILYLQLVLFF
jgi:hypothetical protein